MSIRGIDVSDYQPNVNWQAVAKGGILFAFVKSTEGATLVSQTFARNWTGMKAAGIQRGAYHFFRPASSIQGQIDLFLKTVKLEAGDLPAVLDVETTGGLSGDELCDRATTWLEAVEKATLMRPIIYTYPGFWDNLGTQRLADYPLWIAHYTSAEEPWVPGGWKTWTFWQYSDTSTVSGVSGNVDANIFESVREGAINYKVADIQKQLRTKGFYQGAMDGKFGATTTAALISFQKSQNLNADGLAGIKTWAALMRKSPKVIVPPPTPTPTPKPTPTPTPISAARLTELFSSYQASASQDTALIWLQSQVSTSVLGEFAQKWRTTAAPQDTNLRLIDVGKFYRGLAEQDQALDWLQKQISPAVIAEFAQKWRAQSTVPISPIRLIDACKFYRAAPNQNQALDWLEGKISPRILSEFLRRWQNAGGDGK
ncbi:MAG: peptidoglycan-binding protein [Microcoleus sp. PH2017_10_PVI_O_A]|uniref:GH25 family lysozyme n=1 Tax=unclassified Microcoleus TaxID=2642155 RepID=UPI001DC2BE91|nr:MULTISPECIES: GH25 family lysozyme [unclassified Microcoleus]TAE84236.1 MAG: hydrolase [Oscillatoriales cyanobacterium]MCC3405388.1 peptidoglycan-binding protein [Microcoleus sp. PH2017_10_PVI_O_A]MCC3459379.1 peptidoglycan-binding protein [Microcoleus sp. PH2017_11_PCY_U_A]MCC3477660.1 peptidoglycan-binding protein [Microcoleus sp. PH2017_12_PCY_D_A]MCC3528285.1 peptidoglycan-binding protein [Microcoleus sp. PH2017_21_RUC_O_A]